MRVKFLTPKNVDQLFFTLMLSITHLLFFILTPTKTYLDLRQQILPYISNIENRSSDFINQIIANI